ncbi:MAG: hypothetical protein ACE5R5_00030 [Nitrosarchaeum sp.]
MSGIEEQNQILFSKSHISPELPDHIKSKGKKNDFVSSNFPCDFLYAWKNCDNLSSPITYAKYDRAV